jgi:hypothetical protein
VPPARVYAMTGRPRTHVEGWRTSMPKAASKVNLKAALLRERRKNRRLRALIDTIREDVRQNRRDLNLQFTRLAQMQTEIDALKGSRERAANM